MDLKKLEEELKKENPLINLPIKERYWLIDYMKLKKGFETYHEEFTEQYKKCHNTEFPTLQDAYYPLISSRLPAWKRHEHPVNFKLQAIKYELEHLEVDWERIQDYERPKYISCEYDDCPGRECQYFGDCDLTMLKE